MKLCIIYYYYKYGKYFSSLDDDNINRTHQCECVYILNAKLISAELAEKHISLDINVYKIHKTFHKLSISLHALTHFMSINITFHINNVLAPITV